MVPPLVFLLTSVRGMSDLQNASHTLAASERLGSSRAACQTVRICGEGR